MIDAAMSSSSIEQAMLTLGDNARRASRAMMRADSAAKNQALIAMADALAASHDELKAANERDVAAARANGLEPALLDRAHARLDALFTAAGRRASSPTAARAVAERLLDDLDVPGALDVAVDEGGDAARLAVRVLSFG